MRSAVLALLFAILLVAIANLPAAPGVIGKAGSGSSRDHEYKERNACQMDRIGFRLNAQEQGWTVKEEAEADYLKEPSVQNLAKWMGAEIAEDNTLTFPKEMNEFNLLPRTNREVE